MATVSLAELRARIRELEGAPQVHSTRVPSGVRGLDGLIGGLVRPGLIELNGPAGSGAVQLALEVAAAETDTRRRVAWVDAERSLYPPAARAVGVDLDRLLIVRPPAAGNQGGQHPGVWATEQLLRSGCVRLVISTVPTELPRFAGQRWRQASEQGGSTALLITRAAARHLQPDVRLAVSPDRLVVTRDRQRGAGAITVRTSSQNPTLEAAWL